MKSEDEFFTDDEIKALWSEMYSVVPRIVRGLGYAAVAYILASLNAYGLTNAFWLAAAIGLLGTASVNASARLGQIAIGLLLVMAVLPPDAVAKIVTVSRLG